MIRNDKKICRHNLPTSLLVFVNAIILEESLATNAGLYWLLLLTGPALIVTLVQNAKA